MEGNSRSDDAMPNILRNLRVCNVVIPCYLPSSNIWWVQFSHIFAGVDYCLCFFSSPPPPHFYYSIWLYGLISFISADVYLGTPFCNHSPRHSPRPPSLWFHMSLRGESKIYIVHLIIFMPPTICLQTLSSLPLV